MAVALLSNSPLAIGDDIRSLGQPYHCYGLRGERRDRFNLALEMSSLDIELGISPAAAGAIVYGVSNGALGPDDARVVIAFKDAVDLYGAEWMDGVKGPDPDEVHDYCIERVCYNSGCDQEDRDACDDRCELWYDTFRERIDALTDDNWEFIKDKMNTFIRRVDPARVPYKPNLPWSTWRSIPQDTMRQTVADFKRGFRMKWYEPYISIVRNLRRPVTPEELSAILWGMGRCTCEDCGGMIHDLCAAIMWRLATPDTQVAATLDPFVNRSHVEGMERLSLSRLHEYRTELTRLGWPRERLIAEGVVPGE